MLGISLWGEPQVYEISVLSTEDFFFCEGEDSFHI